MWRKLTYFCVGFGWENFLYMKRNFIATLQPFNLQTAHDRRRGGHERRRRWLAPGGHDKSPAQGGHLPQCSQGALWPPGGHNQPATGPYILLHPVTVPLNPLPSSKASATLTCAHAVHAHTHENAFHSLSFFSAAIPTSGHLFPPHGFLQPVLRLPAVTRPACVEECVAPTPHAPALHATTDLRT